MAAEDVIITATRYQIARIQIVRFMAPVAILLGVLARRIMETSLVLAASAVILVVLGVAVTARRGLGRRSIELRNGVIRFAKEPGSAKSSPDPTDDVPVRSIHSWTWNGSIARLYGSELSWKIHSCDGKDEALEEMLRRALGPALALRRRGTPRARAMALSIAALGLAALGVGIAYETTALALIGVPCSIGGLAALGAFSQSVVR